MIRNEGKIIRRCLESAKSIIDAVFVLDTGSTDNTKEQVNSFLTEYNIPGKICEEKFVDFGTSRSKSFHLARQYLREDLKWDERNTYGLLLDADHILVVRPPFDKQNMIGQFDHYKLRQKDTCSYYNIRLIRMSENWICVGKTHEVWTVKNKDSHVGAIVQDKDLIWIDDKSDGGCKADKYERDERLLLAGLDEDIDIDLRSRYYFYLGQTYNALKNYKKSNKYYMKRIEMNGWDEEKWFSMFVIVKNFIQLNNLEPELYIPEIESWAKRAYEFRPTRCESLFVTAEEFIRLKKFDMAQKYIDMGKTINHPPENELLFVDDDIYSYGFDILQLKLNETRGDIGKENMHLCLSILERIDKNKANYCILHMLAHVPIIPKTIKQGFIISSTPYNLSINYKANYYELLLNDSLIFLNENFLQIDMPKTIDYFKDKKGIMLSGNLFTSQSGLWGTLINGVTTENELKKQDKICINENLFLDSIVPWKVNGKVLSEKVPKLFNYVNPCLPAVQKDDNEFLLLLTGNIESDDQKQTLLVLVYVDKNGNYVKHSQPFYLEKDDGVGVCSFAFNRKNNTSVLIYFSFKNNVLSPRLAEIKLDDIPDFTIVV